jgi:hypothetical protein
MWWAAREAIRVGENQPEPILALPTDEEIRAWRLPRGSDFKAQFLAPLYESDMRERVIVYDKRISGKEKTKSLPVKSPDLAHAFILGVDQYLRQDQVPLPRKPPTTGEEALHRMMQEQIARTRKPRIRNPYQR